jgi:valyl-tRNA synthetase
MPFITEEIWHALYEGKPPAKSIALTRFPQAHDFASDDAAVAQMTSLQELIVAVRALRKELGVPEKEPAPIRIHAAANITAAVQANADMLSRLARVSGIETASAALTGANARSTATFDVTVLYQRQIDVAAERTRLIKELEKLNKQIDTNEQALADPKFTGKAPAHIVEGRRKQTDEQRTVRDKVLAALDALPPE